MPTKNPGGNGRLPRKILDWSIRSIREHDDNDLFSKPFEFDVFDHHWKELVEELMELRVDHFRWSPARRMVLPKDRVSFRRASQLDPVDSLILTAIVKLLGNKIEQLRLPRDQVFSNRFVSNGTSLYGTQGGWEAFWKKSGSLAARASFVARSDIADFYGQVWHAEIVRQLEVCGAPDRITAAVGNFLSAFSGHQRGVPIGPHAVHLLAELSLTRADRLLEAKGIKFIRYIDDYHMFCDSEDEAQLALMALAEVLLADDFAYSLNRVKTGITPAAEFRAEAKDRSREDSVDERESALLDAIKSVTDSDYDFVNLSEVLAKDASFLSDEVVSEIVKGCLDADPIDYPKVAWLLRRLSQVGAPGAIDLIVEDFDSFVPIIGSAARYLAQAGANWSGEWTTLGDRLLKHADRPISKRSPYVEMILYSLFAARGQLNHFGEVTARFDRVQPTSRRELVLAAKGGKLTDWLHSLRTQAGQFDPWTTRAYISALSVLPAEQAGECLVSINVEAQSTESILLRNLMSERVDRIASQRDPAGPAWRAVVQQVPADRRSFVDARLDELGASLAAQIYDQRRGKFLIATWNLRNFGGGAFGFGDRLPESLVYIARVILSFDLIAIQEIQSREPVDRLLQLLGDDWQIAIGGEAVGPAGNKERTAFLYRKNFVKALGSYEQLTLKKSELILKKHQFARPPFLVEFQLGKWKILAASAHVYFGAQSGMPLDQRVAEIATLAKVMVRMGEERGATPMLLGDFNIVAPNHKTMKPLEQSGLALPTDWLTPTNAGGDRYFTQIAFRPTHKGPRAEANGVFKVFDFVFRDCDYQRYEAGMRSSIAWDTKETKGAKATKAARATKSAKVEPFDFYKTWRTMQMSDHYPVWTDLG